VPRTTSNALQLSVALPSPKISVEAGLGDEVEIYVRDRAIILTSVKKPHAGWAEAAKLMRDKKDDHLIDSQTDTDFDRNNWRW